MIPPPLLPGASLGQRFNRLGCDSHDVSIQHDGCTADTPETTELDDIPICEICRELIWILYKMIDGLGPCQVGFQGSPSRGACIMSAEAPTMFRRIHCGPK
jgi:hypothetical protein